MLNPCFPLTIQDSTGNGSHAGGIRHDFSAVAADHLEPQKWSLHCHCPCRVLMNITTEGKPLGPVGVKTMCMFFRGSQIQVQESVCSTPSVQPHWLVCAGHT